MFCQFCGAAIPAEVETCPQCGKARPSVTRSDMPNLGNQVRASSKDAAEVLKQLLRDPVGGLPVAYAGLGPSRALSAGIVLCVGFAFAAAGGVTMGAGQWLSGLYMLTGGAFGSTSGFSGFLQMAIQFAVLPAVLAVVGFGVRKVAGVQPVFAADAFTAGAALVPLGLATLLAGLLGVANFEVILILLLFALSYLILMLFSGLTRVGGMTEGGGAPAVPVMILLAGWLVSVVFRAM